jgi:hypothetical protein
LDVLAIPTAKLRVDVGKRTSESDEEEVDEEPFFEVPSLQSGNDFCNSEWIEHNHDCYR